MKTSTIMVKWAICIAAAFGFSGALDQAAAQPYKLHSDGSVYRFAGGACNASGCPGWQLIDRNPQIKVLVASGATLFQLHADGSIYRFTGAPCTGSRCPGWQLLDRNPQTRLIAGDGNELYQLHANGSIFRFTGTPCGSINSCPGWQQLDRNSQTRMIAAATGGLYQLQNGGLIYKYAGTGWQLLDRNPQTTMIAAAQTYVYQMHSDGSIYGSYGEPCRGNVCSGWQTLDRNPQTRAIFTASGLLFQYQNDGELYRFTGTACTANGCPGWQLLDNRSRDVKAFASGANQFYKLHNNGELYRYTAPCSGNNCTGWQLLDRNPQTVAIAMGSTPQPAITIDQGQPIDPGPRVVGPIEQKWRALGAGGGRLGKPTANETPTFDGAGRSQVFAGGVISWHPQTGAHAIFGPILARWTELGRERFGYPATDEMATADGAGRFNHFRSLQIANAPEASIYWRVNLGAHEVLGAIRQKWIALGAERSPLGYPTAAESPTFDRVGRAQNFVGGIISWHPQLGAFGVSAAIGARWREIGREQFGYPTTDEMRTADGAGRYNHFKAMHMQGTHEASIFWSASTGAHEVYGGIREKWAALGWERSPLGYPTAAEVATFDRAGRAQDFAGGRISYHPQLGTHAVTGLIAVRWRQIGVEQFGYPITDEVKTADGAGRYNHFKALDKPGAPEGSIFWSAGTGAREIFGHIRNKWAELGWERSFLGYPTGGEGPTFDGAGRWQAFSGGVISWHDKTGPHAVGGSILVRWTELGRERFGYPITDEVKTPDGAGRYNHFKALDKPGAPEGSIYWSAGTGAHEVFGHIRNKWAELGWEGSFLGYPTGSEGPTFDGAGRWQTFAGGVISWHDKTGPHAVGGSILVRWTELGRERFGYPITDETKTPDGEGRYNHFKALDKPGEPEGSIYWTNGTGVHAVYGGIRNKWADLGWERSALGYPTGPERDRPGGGRIQDFQNGSIGWTLERGPFLEWVRQRQIITTPSGTALGGWAELEIRQDGSYNFRGHMHDSGAEDYKFRVRAAISSKTGFVVVAQKSGDVEGTQIFGTPRRDFDWDERGTSDILKSEWENIELGTFQVAKAYEGGFTGALEAVWNDLLSFVISDIAFGPQVAMVMFIGNEITSITGSGTAGGLVVAGGISWLISPNLKAAIPLFVGLLAATEVLTEHRSPTQEEYDFAKMVFGDTLPPREKITFTNISGKDGRAFVFKTPTVPSR